MPIYNMKCQSCDHVFEYLAKNSVIKYAKCPECGMKSKKIFSAEGQNFNLKYNPKKDVCDWNGNTTRFYDEYKKMKAEGKNPRIPALDGDG